ncbi:hypothetical protein JS756_34670 [Streptomyces actuosus]|uniref:Transposase Helix-turn-helix domain-containing protein n=1 Tax=Streptomyces actuosus TaxID=1885 RepID=A0ABS2W142_STRAS|nr:hypothetical protein [Streptomyces actuosus]
MPSQACPTTASRCAWPATPSCAASPDARRDPRPLPESASRSPSRSVPPPHGTPRCRCATIGATRTRTGLAVHAELDPGAYPTGVTVSDDVMDRLPLSPHDWHGTWNYTMRPEPLAPPLPARPAEFGRFPAGDKRPARLRHPSLTGLEPAAFDDLAARYRAWRAEHPPILLPGKRPDGGPGAGGRRLSAADQLVVFLLKKRWSMTNAVLAEATGLSKSRIGATLWDAAPVLTALGHTASTGALTVTTAQQLAAIAGHDLASSRPAPRSRSY